jgi:hypothetical protein
MPCGTHKHPFEVLPCGRVGNEWYVTMSQTLDIKWDVTLDLHIEGAKSSTIVAHFFLCEQVYQENILTISFNLFK